EHGMTKTYDTLRFLALLSLTADNIPLSRNLIVKKLPGDGTQRPVRGDVLAAYFDGKAPSLGFVRTQWTACIKTFKGMLIGDDEDFTKLQVISEKTYLLEKLAAKLELPDPGMGHLFWGLFWYDKLQSDGLEPVLVQKLAAHLLKAEPTTIEEEKTYERI